KTRRIPGMNSELSGAARQAVPRTQLRHDWKKEEVAAIYATPLPELVYRAQTLHRKFHAPDRVQTCQLISIKTGGCPEDCAYCPQSAHYEAGVEREGLLDPQHVISAGRDANVHGRGLEGSATGPRVRDRPGNGAGSFLAGHGSLLHPGHADEPAGRAAEGSGAHSLQSQSGHLAGILWLDHHHPRVR